jgi:hypothetical protein
MADYILPPVTVTALRQPAQTQIVPNPMHQYASWSYAWSLWWLDTADYNNLMNTQDVTDALNWTPSSNSWVIAEDSGLFPDRRYPGRSSDMKYPGPLNYNIDSVEFETTIAANKQTRSSNLIEGAMTIVEPYGVTFLDSLIDMSFDTSTGTYKNYTQHPFMLQCDFTGYDDTGTPIPDNITIYRKRFPIKLLSMEIEVNKGGSTYNISFCASGQIAHRPELSTTPAQFTITAGTVEEFFNGGILGSDGQTVIPGLGLAAQLNNFYCGEIGTGDNGAAQYADQFRFIIDPTIGKSSIVDGSQVSLLNVAPGAAKIDQSKQEFKIPAKTAIVDIITRIMCQSDYLINKQQLNVANANSKANATNITPGTDLLSLFKTTVSSKLAGANKSGALIPEAFDTKRQLYPMLSTFNIHQSISFDGKHPATNSQLADSRQYAVKSYSYLYTGENIDIVDFKLNFENTYYTSIMAYQSGVATQNVTQATIRDTTANRQPAIGYNPTVVFNVPNLTPPRYRATKLDTNVTAGGIYNRPDAVVAMDVIKSIYTDLSGGDQVSLELTIVGDPTLIRQDDWLYVPDPVNATQYNSWDSVGQDQYAAKYGHIRMDTSEVIVTLTVNSPIDIDDGSYNNTGLMYPAMDGTNTYTSLFSGQYKIITIKNMFRNGKFEQVITAVRFMQSDILLALNNSVVRLGQINQTGTASRN